MSTKMLTTNYEEVGDQQRPDRGVSLEDLGIGSGSPIRVEREKAFGKPLIEGVMN